MNIITEQEYFKQTVKKILTQIGYTAKINITILDHSTLKGKAKKTLGICWRNQFDICHITIDEFFVHECYTYFILDSITSTWELNGQTLEKVICHELAHVQQWNHCKKHDRIMCELYDMVTKPDKYYQYLRKEMDKIA